MIKRILQGLAALLVWLSIGSTASAQPAPGVCAGDPDYFGCYGPASSVNLGNTLPLVTPFGSKDVSVGTLLGAAALPSQATTVPKFVYIGGVGIGFATLANASNNAQMLASGLVGLYQHANGMAPLTSAQRTALWATWGVTGVTPTGQGQSVGEVGCYATVPSDYRGYFGGSYPLEVNMNCIDNNGDGSGTYTAVTGDAHPGTVYTGYTTAGDLVTIKAGIDGAIAAGAKNVAVYLTPNGGGEDLDDPFATSAYWANVRLAALYGGGIALDLSSNFDYVQRAPQYASMVKQMILWARAQGIRSSVSTSVATLTSPDYTNGDPTCGYDPLLLEHNQRMLADLTSAGAIPSQFIVQNYAAVPGCNGNDVATDTTPESLNAVALYIARTITPATPGTTAPQAPGGLAEAGLMNTAVTVSPVRMALPVVRTGPIRLADIAGLGDMAAQPSNGVNISGGTINGPVTLTTTGALPFFQTGAVIGGPTGAGAVTQVNPPGTLQIVAPGGGPENVNITGNLTVGGLLTNVSTTSPQLFQDGVIIQTSGGPTVYITASAGPSNLMKVQQVGGGAANAEVTGDLTVDGKLTRLLMTNAPLFQGDVVIQSGATGIAIDLNTNGITNTLNIQQVGGAPSNLNVTGTLTAGNVPSADPHLAGQIYQDSSHVCHVSTGP